MRTSQEKKEVVRLEMKRLEKEHFAYFKETDRKISETLIRFFEKSEAETYFCYIPFQNEPDIMPAIFRAQEMKKKIAVPRCEKNGIMTAILLKDIQDLKPGMYGILEPDRGAPVLNAENIDVIMLPGVAFSKNGKRLGRGGGYYDRFCEKFHGLMVGIAREYMLQDDLPCEKHDVKVDVIITEERTIQTK